MTDTFFNIMHRLNSLIAGACLLFGGSLLNAQDATVRIHDAGTGVTIPAEIYGQFSEHLGRCIYGERGSGARAVRRLPQRAAIVGSPSSAGRS